MSQPLSLQQCAAVLGRCREVEFRLFVLTGHCCAAVRSDGLAVFLASASRSHGYRVGLFDALLPVSDGLVDAAALDERFATGLDMVFEDLEASEEATLFRALCEVIYPASRAGLSSYLDATFSASDEPLRQALHRALFELSALQARSTALFAEIESGEPAMVEKLSRDLGELGGLYGERAGSHTEQR